MTRTNSDRIDQLAKDTVETGSRVENLEQQVQKDLKEVREALVEQQDSAVDAMARAIERMAGLELKAELSRERDTSQEKETNKLREETAELRKENTDLRRELAEARQETAVLKQQLQDHIKQTDLADSRRWGLIVLLLGAVLSLASGLIVTLAKK